MRKIAFMSFVVLPSVGVLFSCKKKEQKSNYTCTCPCIIENGIAAIPGPVEILSVTAEDASSRCQSQTDAFNAHRKTEAAAAGKGDVESNYVCQLEKMLE